MELQPITNPVTKVTGFLVPAHTPHPITGSIVKHDIMVTQKDLDTIPVFPLTVEVPGIIDLAGGKKTKGIVFVKWLSETTAISIHGATQFIHTLPSPVVFAGKGTYCMKSKCLLIQPNHEVVKIKG